MNTFSKSKTESDELVILPGILDEFRTALQDEIAEVKKSGSSSILIKNGKRVNTHNDTFWYTFDVEYLPQLPPDSPCKLIIGIDSFPVTVVACEESSIIISSDNLLPDALGNARLENGATVLMERLINRIETRVDDVNTAGYRMLPAYFYGEKSVVDTIDTTEGIIYSLDNNEAQKRAVQSALTNNITFIWGPPGTGKTTVIGDIVRNLFNRGRKVLIVSHTNTAVDGAISQILRKDKFTQEPLHREDGTCPVLRIGNASDELPDEAKLRYHTDRMGKSYFEQKEILEAEKKQLNIKTNEINEAIGKAKWVEQFATDGLLDIYKHLEDVVTEMDAAYAHFFSASSKAKNYKAEHPELDSINDAETLLSQRQAALEETASELEKTKDALVKAQADNIYAKSEIDNHKEHNRLSAKLEELPTENFIEYQISESIKSIDENQKKLEKLNADKATLQAEIERRSHSFFRFGKAKLEAAHISLQSAEEEIAACELDLRALEKSKVSYEDDLISLRSLKMQLGKVHITETLEYWSSIAESSGKDIDNLPDKINELSALYANTVSVVKALQEEYNSLVSINAEFQSLNNAVKETKVVYDEYDRQYNSIKNQCHILTEKGIALLGIFDDRVSLNAKHIDGKIEALRDLYNVLKSELNGQTLTSLIQDKQEIADRITEINKEMESINAAIASLEKLVIQNTEVVGATLAKTYLSDELQETYFDTVILDEASMASIPALWCATYIAKRNLIIVGDFLQLPPIVMASTRCAKDWLGRDIFNVSGMQNIARKGVKKPAHFVMLNHQYRMESTIADIANLYYGEYSFLISDDNSRTRKESRAKFLNWYPLDKKERSIELIDTSNLNAWVTTIQQGKHSVSRLNNFSAALSVELALKCISPFIDKIQHEEPWDKKTKVLIVAPYKPHVTRINKLIAFHFKRLGLPSDTNLIKVGTIHSFQGQEADIVIFDTVIDEPHWRCNLFMPTEDANANNKKMFNVAITRAKYKLFVIGNIPYCQKKAKSNAFGQLLSKLVDEEKYTIHDAKKDFPNLTFSVPTSYFAEGSDKAKHLICRENVFLDYLLDDIHKANSRIVMFSPFITSNRLAQLLPALSDATSAGKEVIVVSKAIQDRKKSEVPEYKRLESALRKHGITVFHKAGMHEKLIFIDDDIVWVGSLNTLSFSGSTGEIMQRQLDKEIAKDYRSIYNIPSIVSAVENSQEQKCPICDGEMALKEGDSGSYWECENGDYSRNVNQPYPYDGILRCSKCNGNYLFKMKNEPRWVCSNDSHHFQKVNFGDLKLKKMEALVPLEELQTVRTYLDKKREEYMLKHNKSSVNLQSDNDQYSLF